MGSLHWYPTDERIGLQKMCHILSAQGEVPQVVGCNQLWCFCCMLIIVRIDAVLVVEDVLSIFTSQIQCDAGEYFSTT